MKLKDVNFKSLFQAMPDTSYFVICGEDRIEVAKKSEQYGMLLNNNSVYAMSDSSLQSILNFLSAYLAERDFELDLGNTRVVEPVKNETLSTPKVSEETDGKKSYAEKKKAELNATYKLLDETAEKVFTRSSSSAELFKVLDVYSRFKELGVTNALLIYAQQPNATDIQPVADWSKQGFQFKRGQHGFYIIKRGKEYTKADGKKGYYRNAVKYFDVAQTTAPARERKITTYASHALVAALTMTSPVKYENYIPENNDGDWPPFIKAKYFPDQKKIAVRKGLSAAEYFIHFSTAVAMAMLDRGVDFKNNLTAYQFDAKCIAYLLSKRYNIDCSTFDFDDIPSDYMNYDTTRIKKKFYEITEIEKVIHEKMYKNLEAVLKNYQKTVDDTTKSIGVYQDTVR
ncbi:MAG: hypothetical protein IJ168_02120 [Eubacterium sp.]|nr:hypothetical protein [Eubacterium sp.]